MIRIILPICVFFLIIFIIKFKIKITVFPNHNRLIIRFLFLKFKIPIKKKRKKRKKLLKKRKIITALPRLIITLIKSTEIYITSLLPSNEKYNLHPIQYGALFAILAPFLSFTQPIIKDTGYSGINAPSFDITVKFKLYKVIYAFTVFLGNSRRRKHV